MGRATARPPVHEPATLNAPLFQQLVEVHDPPARRVVLDLGAATTPMLALLGRNHCHVQIADIVNAHEIRRLNGAEPGEKLDELVGSLLPPHCAVDPVDLVFCWDLPNYLQPTASRALMRAIEERTQPGSMAHALIVYSERDMPDRPRRYVPTGDGQLVNHANPTAMIDAPRYSPEALGNIMSPFAIDRARLLSNGMQEFLFRR